MSHFIWNEVRVATPYYMGKENRGGIIKTRGRGVGVQLPRFLCS